MSAVSPSPAAGTAEDVERGKIEFSLGNDLVYCKVFVEDGTLLGDRLEARKEWPGKYGESELRIETDADFQLDLMWNGWRAPGKLNNSENPLLLTKKDFHYVRSEEPELPDSERGLDLFFEGRSHPFELRVSYRLDEKAFYVRRKLALRDPQGRNHFLRWYWPRRGEIIGNVEIVKAGGYGQPAAILGEGGGAFFGVEYPAAENHLESQSSGGVMILCGHELGRIVGADEWVESEWVVLGLSPDRNVKLWFMKYIDRIRVAPLRPFLLYNTWYDVRAQEYTERPEDVMNEANLLRIIADFKREMVGKRGLRLDAFVLDDGWDVYKSDWVLREKEFPNGLAPIASALEGMGTDLGVWFGPIGGYSHRDWRVGWMRDHGYEVINNDQLCLAGKKYGELFKKRVVDFVRDAGVGYFKWDGIQFSCSNPDHGHPVGIYSRRAVMEKVIELCRAVRAENPDIFLNITSGTWLSPWWVQYADTIWMQGYDYGYSDVPSISRRDGAITYRDFVLYEDFRKNGFWFPLANLMTHGIIKGHLQKLGGEAEPLDKFTDNALLYFARGVAMWELYISPNLLSDGEWNAIAKSIRWAEDRFDILRSTEMIGGDPGKSEAYGYVHFAGERGIVAARNPFIEPRTLEVELSPALGLDPKAESLVLERVYPTRWVSAEAAARRHDIRCFEERGRDYAEGL